MGADAQVGLVGLAVMGQVRPALLAAPQCRLRPCVMARPFRSGRTARAPLRAQNLALNIAEKGFPISVYNRSPEKTDAAEDRAKKSGASRHALARAFARRSWLVSCGCAQLSDSNALHAVLTVLRAQQAQARPSQLGRSTLELELCDRRTLRCVVSDQHATSSGCAASVNSGVMSRRFSVLLAADQT